MSIPFETFACRDHLLLELLEPGAGFGFAADGSSSCHGQAILRREIFMAALRPVSSGSGKSSGAGGAAV
jgi:hypothetical protein